MFYALQNQSKRLMRFNAFLILVYLIFPAVIETIYLLSCNDFIVLIMSAAYVFCVFSYLIIQKLLSRKRK
jgi:hypothetical protein